MLNQKEPAILGQRTETLKFCIYVVNSLLFSKSAMDYKYLYMLFSNQSAIKAPCEPEVTLGTFQIKKDRSQCRN